MKGMCCALHPCQHWPSVVKGNLFLTCRVLKKSMFPPWGCLQIINFKGYSIRNHSFWGTSFWCTAKWIYWGPLYCSFLARISGQNLHESWSARPAPSITPDRHVSIQHEDTIWIYVEKIMLKLGHKLYVWQTSQKDTVICFDMFWYALICFDMLYALIMFDTIWYVLIIFDMRWYASICSDMLICCDMLWYTYITLIVGV